MAPNRKPRSGYVHEDSRIPPFHLRPCLTRKLCHPSTISAVSLPYRAASAGLGCNFLVPHLLGPPNGGFTISYSISVPDSEPQRCSESIRVDADLYQPHAFAFLHARETTISHSAAVFQAPRYHISFILTYGLKAFDRLLIAHDE